jgi:hypothetical protein
MVEYDMRAFILGAEFDVAFEAIPNDLLVFVSFADVVR